MSEGADWKRPPEVQEVVNLLRQAARRAQQIILNPPGRSAKTQRWNASRAAQELAAYRRELRSLGVKVDAVTGRVIRDAYRSGRQFADRQLADADVSRPPLRASFTAVDTRRAEALARSARADLRKALGAMGDTTERLVRQANAEGLDRAKVARILGGGAIEGIPKPTLQRLRQEMRAIARGGVVEIINRQTGVVTHFKPDTYADLVYQTHMAMAEEAAAHQRYREAGIDLVRIIGSNSTNYCTAFVGKVYSLSGTHPVYPAFSLLPGDGPPFHPRCTKRTIPFNPLLATPAQIEKAQPDQRTDALHRKSPADAQRDYTRRQREEEAKAKTESKKAEAPQTPAPPKQPVQAQAAPRPTPATPAQPTSGVPRRRPDLPAESEFARRLARDAARPINGATPDEVAAALEITPQDALALIHGICPKIGPFDGAVDVSLFPGNSVYVRMTSGGSEIRRLIERVNGQLVCHAELFVLDDSLRGQGLGRSIFTEMAEQLARLGVDRIDTLAARIDDAHHSMNGYLVWPRLGYNAPLVSLPEPVRQAIQAAGFQVHNRTLLDLISTEAGLALWREIGVTTEMTLDLRQGSRSWRELRRRRR